MTQKFESGWENPDRHEPMTERPRPMFDEHGNAVDKAPAPEPEELEFLRPGNPAARLSAAAVGRVGTGHAWHEHAERDRADVDKAPAPEPIAFNPSGQGQPAGPDRPELSDRLDAILHPGDERMVNVPVSYLSESNFKRRILAIVEPALDSPTPAGWAVALEKVRELCS